MESDKLINTCERLLEYIINGFIIDDEVVFGLFTDTDLSISELSVSDIDISIIKIAIVLFCINNDNISINTDGDIEIGTVNKMSTSTQYGGANEILTETVSALGKRTGRALSKEIHIPTTHVRANKSVYMIYRYLFLLIKILSIATGLRSLFYLYQNTFEAKWLIMSQSVDKLISLSDNYPSKDVVEDVEQLIELIQEYNLISDTNKPLETSREIVFIESFTRKIANLKETQLDIPLQLAMPDENIDIFTLIDLKNPIISILHIYRYYMNYFFKLRQSKIEELLYNNEVYIQVEIYFHEKKEILEEANEIFKKFKEQLQKEPEQLEIKSYGETFINGVKGYFSGKASTVDIARSKIALLNSIVDKWTKIMIKAPTETSYAISSIFGFITNISTIINLVQEQILISCTIYGFFQFILYLIYQKFIFKKIPTDDWVKIRDYFQPIVEESVKIYFSNHNVDKNDQALQDLTNTFIDLFHAKITDPTSGLINYGTTPEETIQLNKQEVQEYILSCIDILVKDHSSRNDIIHNMIISLFKREHIFTNKDLDEVYKSMTLYFEKDSVDEDNPSLKNPRIFRLKNGPDDDDEKEKIEGGKKHNKKSRKTRTIKTRRHKRSKKYKRTRKHKRSKMNRRTRRSKK